MEIAMYCVGFICPAGSSVAGMGIISTRWNEYSSTLLVNIDYETTKKNSIFSLCFDFGLGVPRLTADL
jgi:hypothetical protein